MLAVTVVRLVANPIIVILVLLYPLLLMHWLAIVLEEQHHQLLRPTRGSTFR